MGWERAGGGEGGRIELDDDGAAAAVSGRSSAWGQARPWALVAVGVVVGIAVSTVFSGADRSDPSSTVGVTTTVVSSVAATVGSVVSASPVTASIPSTTGSVLLPPVLPPVLPLGHRSGIVLYLTPDGGAPDELIAYDLDSGQSHRLGLGRDVGWYVGAVEAAGGVVVDGGQVVLVAHGVTTLVDDGGQTGFADAPTGRLAAGPDGRVWLRRFDPEGIVLLDAVGSPTGPAFALPRGADLYGSMADGRPVVRGADGRVFVVELDGHRTLLATNALNPVEAGRFVETRCTDEQQCSLIAHLDDREVDLGPPRGRSGETRQVRFQPGGSLIAVVDGISASLIDTISGADIADIAPNLAGNFIASVRFLPDGAGLVAATWDGLQLVDLSGKTIATIARPPGNMPGTPLLGVGRATPWSSS